MRLIAALGVMKTLSFALLVAWIHIPHAEASDAEWRKALVASSIKSSVELHLKHHEHNAIPGLLHALATQKNPQSDKALSELVNYYLGESSGEELEALIVNRGAPIVRNLEAQIDSACLKAEYCLQPDQRNERVRRLLELIRAGTNLELVP